MSNQQTPEPKRNADGSLYTVMPKVGGKFFRCPCGCNVFHHPDKTDLDKLECNSCGEWYTSQEAK